MAGCFSRIQAYLGSASCALTGVMMNRASRSRAAQSDAEPTDIQENQNGKWVFVDTSAAAFKSLYSALNPWQRELIARRWLKTEHLY